MNALATWSAAVYVAGVVLGLIKIDATPLPRLGLALLWPLGPVAFIATIAILLMASLVAFPIVGAAVLLAMAIAWWIFG